MNKLDTTLRRLGGIADRRELRTLGVSDHELTDAVRLGTVARLRRGWYSVLEPSDPRHRARALGGRLTGASALRFHGGWMWSDPPLSISVPSNASRLPPRPEGVRAHYDRRAVTARGGRAEVDLRDALTTALGEVAFEDAVALLDWSLHAGLLDSFDRLEALNRLPRYASRIGEWVDDECQSFLESVVRTRLRVVGHSTVTQTPLPNGQWIDIVVDGVVGLELDSKTFHASSFESDRRKDAVITIDGKHAIRASYDMVAHEWPTVLAAIEAAIRHRRVPLAVPLATRIGRVHGPREGMPWSLAEARPRRAGMRGRADRLPPL
jgi:very-short-patch-repair endonuclease